LAAGNADADIPRDEMKIVTVVGARPHFIKCAPLSKELSREHDEILVHTGQHYDHNMSSLFFEELGIPKPDYNLGIGSGNQGEQTGRMIAEIEKVLLKESPDAVLVYGDTNSTLAGALAASKLHIKLAHVEAGLRSFDKTMPEEINRILTDHCSDLLLAPTKTAVTNLGAEGIKEGVRLVGDVMLDALMQNLVAAEKSSVLRKLGLREKDYLLATVHRQSNTDDAKNLASILEAFAEIGGNIVFPVHPRTMKFIRQNGLERRCGKNVSLVEPLGYLDFLALEKNAKKILTDSGGIQKEAYMLKVPCITLRDNTEWVETVEDGWNILVGTDKKRIVEAATGFNPASGQRNVFGEGGSSRKIVECLMAFD